MYAILVLIVVQSPVHMLLRTAVNYTVRELQLAVPRFWSSAVITQLRYCCVWGLKAPPRGQRVDSIAADDSSDGVPLHSPDR